MHLFCPLKLFTFLSPYVIHLLCPQREILKKLGGGSAGPQQILYTTVKYLMERIAPIMVDAHTIAILVKLVDDTIRGIDPLMWSVDNAAEKGVRLLQVWGYTHAHTRTHAHTHTHTYIDPLMWSVDNAAEKRVRLLQVWGCTHAHTRTHAHIHAHTYTRTHTRTHIDPVMWSVDNAAENGV
jgi:hypothetical protein